MTLVHRVFGKDSQAPAVLRDDGRVRSLSLTRVLVVLLLVGSVAVHLRAQTLPQPGLVFDAVRRQQITQLYPTYLPEVPQPWFNPLGAVKIALGAKERYRAPLYARAHGARSCPMEKV